MKCWSCTSHGINISSYFKACQQPLMPSSSSSSSSATLFQITIPLLNDISCLSWYFLLDVIEFDSILNIHALFMVLIEFFFLSLSMLPPFAIWNTSSVSLNSSNQLWTMNECVCGCGCVFRSFVLFTRTFFPFQCIYSICQQSSSNYFEIQVDHRTNLCAVDSKNVRFLSPYIHRSWKWCMKIIGNKRREWFFFYLSYFDWIVKHGECERWCCVTFYSCEIAIKNCKMPNRNAFMHTMKSDPIYQPSNLKRYSRDEKFREQEK